MAQATVKTEQIADGAITAAKIADGAIVAAELASNSVTTAKIADDAVTGAKLANTVAIATSITFPDGSAGAPSITNTGDTNTGLLFPAADSIAITTAGAERVRILGNNLFLNGGTDARIQLGSGGAGANSTSNDTVHIRGDGDDMKLMAAADGNYIFENNGSEVVRITANGGVGIAQDDPDSFHDSADDFVIGNSSGSRGMTIRSGSSDEGVIFFADGTGTSGYRGRIEYSHSADTLKLGAGAGTQLTILSSGGITVTGTVTQSTAKTKFFTGQYDGRETNTFTLGSLGFKPQALFCIFNVGTTQKASWGMAARDGGHQALIDYKAQTGSDSYEANGSYLGRLAQGSSAFSNLAVSSWNADEVVIQKSVDNSGSQATVVYRIIVMG